MSDENRESTPVEAKKRKFDEHEKSKEDFAPNLKEDRNQFSPAGPSNEDFSPRIFQLDTKCYEKLFEWLSIKEILSLRCANKRLKKVIEDHINTTYPGVGKFRLNGINFDMFRYMDAGTIAIIKELSVFVGHNFDGTQFETIKELLSRVEKITIFKWQTNFDFYKVFLKHCNNVKCLTMYISDRMIVTSSEWLRHQYPSLEYVFFDIIVKDEINEFTRFFQLNPNIRSLSIDIESLEWIGSDLVSAGITFDRLYAQNELLDVNGLDLLQNLYDKGFYKRLHLTYEECELEDEDLDRLENIGTEVLDSDWMGIIIPPLTSLNEIKFNEHCLHWDTDENIRNTIERFDCSTLFPEQVESYIGEYPKLKHLRINYLYDSYKFDIFEMNKDRKNLPGAYKTTIYVT